MNNYLIKSKNEWFNVMDSIKRVTTPGKVTNDTRDFSCGEIIVENGRTIIQFRFKEKQCLFRTKSKIDGLSSELDEILSHLLKGDIDYKYPQEFYLVCAISLNVLLRGLPLSLELLGTRAIESGVTAKHFTEYNMVYRGILYKLKLLGFSTHMDDEEFNNKKAMKIILNKAKQIQEHKMDLVNLVCETYLKNYTVDREYYNSHVIQTIKDQVQDLYCTTPLIELDIEDYVSKFKSEVIAHPEHFKSPIQGVSITLRHLISTATSEAIRISEKDKPKAPKEGIKYGNHDPYKGPKSKPKNNPNDVITFFSDGNTNKSN